MRMKTTVLLTTILITALSFDNVFAEGVLPQNDFYEYINSDIIEEKKADGREEWNFFIENEERNSRERIIDIIKDAVENRDNYEKNSDEQKIADFYTNYIDYEERNKKGIEPIREYFNRIDSCRTMKELLREDVKISRETGLNGIFPFKCGFDLKNPDRNAVYLDSSYYVYDSIYFNRIYFPSFEDDLKNYMTQLFILSGESEARAKNGAENAYNVIRTMSINATVSSEDLYNEDIVYNVYNRKELQRLLSNGEMEEYLKELGIESGEIIVIDVSFEKILNNMITDQNIEMFKAYNKFIMLDYYAEYLSEDFVREKRKFNSAAGSTDNDLSMEENALRCINEKLGGNIGRVFCRKYSNDEIKADIEKIAEEGRSYYKERLRGIDWLSDSTKGKMIKRLDEMVIKAGYPNEWSRIADEAVIEGDKESIAENIIAIDSTGYRLNLEREESRTDRREWLESIMPTASSAYYDPIQNSVYIPAGILQEPFYSTDYDRAEKLGTIGSIIYHEISHALDSKNFKEQLSEEDYKKIQEKEDRIKRFYDEYKLKEGIHINGELTLQENISDLSGVSCAVYLCGDDEKELRKLFESYAYIWAAEKTDEYMAIRLKYDEHSPEKARVNAVLMNTPEFQRVFRVKKGDNMYIDERKRVEVFP